MKLAALRTHARYLALALPIFALASTIHAGCISGPNGLYYGPYGGRGKTSSAASEPEATAPCSVYHAGYGGYGGYGGYYGPCDDEDGYGGYGGNSP